MKKVKAYERSPFYYETDRMNVIHHSNYIRWQEYILWNRLDIPMQKWNRKEL